MPPLLTCRGRGRGRGRDPDEVNSESDELTSTEPNRVLYDCKPTCGALISKRQRARHRQRERKAQADAAEQALVDLDATVAVLHGTIDGTRGDLGDPDVIMTQEDTRSFDEGQNGNEQLEGKW